MPRLCAPLLLLALAACERPAATPDPAPAPPPAAPAVVRSCPTAARPAPVDLDPQFVVGDVAGVTWLYATADGAPVLAHLGADGRLVRTSVPLPGAAIGAIDGTRAWLFAPGPPARWLSVDLADPQRPLVGAVAPVTTGAADDTPALFAVGRRRALLAVGRPTLDLVLLDTATGTAVAAPRPLDLTPRPSDGFCGADGCALVGVDHVTDGADLQLVVTRVLPDGAREREPLADERGDLARVARLGEQILVAWVVTGGVRLRVLDREGHPLAPSLPVPWDRSRAIRDLRLFAAGDAVVLAIGEDERWSAALVGPHGNPGPLRPLPGASRRLAGAPLGDGLAWVDVGDAPVRDELGAGVLALAPPVEAVGGFLANVGDPAPPVVLARGDAGFTPHLLTRPGAAAALVAPRDRSAPATLTLLRATCRPPTPGERPASDDTCREDAQ